MKKILQNLDSAEKGEFKAKTDSSEMKTILESLQSVAEGYPMPAPPPPAPEDKGTPVSINVSMNASGKEHVADLLDMMKNAGLGDAKPVAPDMMPMRMDMERLRDIVDEPEMDSPCGAGADNRPDEAYMDTEELLSGGDDMHKEKHAADIRVKDPSGYENAEEEIDEYENEPDEKYGDHNQMINDLSGGLNKKKKMFKKAQDGDNAMAVESIKAQLYRALAEKKAKPDFLDMDGDGDKKEPMKKAIKDKKAKK